jgi:hypothetical protein
MPALSATDYDGASVSCTAELRHRVDELGYYDEGSLTCTVER